MKKHWIVTEEQMAGYTLTNIFRLLWQNKFRMHIVLAGKMHQEKAGVPIRLYN